MIFMKNKTPKSVFVVGVGLTLIMAAIIAKIGEGDLWSVVGFIGAFIVFGKCTY